MNRQEHLFTCVGEEGVEVAGRASKIKRFGLLEVEPGKEQNNEQRLKGEVADLCGALELAFPNQSIDDLIKELRPQIEAKKIKIEKFLVYSKEVGTLTE